MVQEVVAGLVDAHGDLAFGFRERARHAVLHELGEPDDRAEGRTPRDTVARNRLRLPGFFQRIG